MAAPALSKPTRGERDNNPMNLRQSADLFIGEVRPSRDPDFKQFQTSGFGIRAGSRVLTAYYLRHGL